MSSWNQISDSYCNTNSSFMHSSGTNPQQLVDLADQNKLKLVSNDPAASFFSPAFSPQSHFDAMYNLNVAPHRGTYNQDKNDMFPGELAYNKLKHFDGYEFPDMIKNDGAFPWSPQNHLGFPPVNKYWPPNKYSGNNKRMNTTTPNNSPIRVTLENKSLMERFDKCCTEMIITKTGRRMFPSPIISLKGLESNTKYFVLFDIVPADDNRYKFHHFNWVIAGKSEPLPPSRMYIHPESPLTGSQWMKQRVSFNKVKLTNNTCDQMGHMILNSMHRYQPRIHIVAAPDIYSIQFQTFHTFVHTECRFIAVTAYQNSQVTALKIESNPFAKGFRKAEKDKRAKRKSESETKPGSKEEKVSSDSETEHKNESHHKRPFYDLDQQKWNMNGNMEVKKENPVGEKILSNGNRAEENTESVLNFNPYNDIPYFSNAERLMQNETEGFNLSTQVRPYPYSADIPNIPFQYKANGPSFI